MPTQSAHQRLTILVGRISLTIIQDMLVGIGLLANLFVVLSARHFPYEDAPNHLARYTVIERILWGEGSQDYSFHWIPTPYIGVDLIGVGLLHLFGPTVAEKVLASAAVVLPIAGMYLLLRATAPYRRGWSFVAVLISFSWPLMAGVLNFILRIGAVLLGVVVATARRSWLVSACHRRRHDLRSVFRPRRGAVVAIGGSICGELVKIPDLRAGGWSAYRVAIRLPVLWTLLLGVTAFGVAWWWTIASGQRTADLGGPLEFRTLTRKVSGFGGPFWVFSLKQAAFTAASYGGLLLIFLMKHARQPLRDPFFIATRLCVLLYLVLLRTLAWIGAGFIRLLPTLLPGRGERLTRSPKILALALLLCLINTTVIANGVMTIDGELDDYDAVLRQIPRGGSRLLELANRRRRVDVYGQFAFWHLIRNDGRVSRIWSYYD